LLRIDDLDTPRNTKGSVDSILKTLDTFGLHWDGSVYYQSHQLDVYTEILEQLSRDKLIYPCTCSRKTLASGDRKPTQPDIYPGTCRDKNIPPDTPHALRVKTGNSIIAFEDELQGPISSNLAKQHGDFILKRKDQIIAYQFAVVVDDNLQNINHVVRGVDLLDSTPKQIHLQQLLGFPTPGYMHVPVIVDEQGYKLSKQTRAQAVDVQTPHLIIFELLSLLKQNPPIELKHAPATELMSWAQDHWNPASLKNSRAISVGIY
jgi:glutamyl-Q tRNA(Asp) synthetase